MPIPIPNAPRQQQQQQQQQQEAQPAITMRQVGVLPSLVDGDDATRSVYFQEQSSFKFETIRTADHFIDGAHQCVYASCKVQTLPRVSSSGAVITIHLDAPPPMTMHE